MSYATGSKYQKHDFDLLVHGEEPAFPIREVAEFPDFKVAANWLERCEQTHDHGQDAENQLPTRLIDAEPMNRGLDPKLVETAVTNVEDNCYVAYSHCWGTRQIKTITTTNTLSAHILSIRHADLPRSFQHAIEATRHLGFRYLWIDSLCIVQDSAEDWENECARMQLVYTNVVLTIAAAGAQDAYSGFRNPRPRNKKDQCWINVPYGSNTRLDLCVRYVPSESELPPETQTPLSLIYVPGPSK